MVSVPPAPDAPARPRADIFAGLSDAADPAADTSARDRLTQTLIEDHLGVARTMAGRYRNRGLDLDDLQQVALLGLTKAAHRFDPDAGHDFLSYAVPTVRGELRRHFRDCGWTVRPPRRVQDLQARIARAEGELLAAHGRSPRPSDLAAHLGVDLDDVVDALSADGCFTPTSLDAPAADSTSTVGELLGSDDDRIREVEAAIMLEPAVRRLSDRDRRIVYLRFYEERSQQEIGDEIGLTQAQVSRVLKRILDDMRTTLDAAVPAA